MSKISFYPIDIQYKIIDDKAVIYIYGRTADNKQVCVIDKNFEPYFLVLPKDLSIKSNLLNVKETKNNQTFYIKDVQLIKKKLLGKERQFFKIVTNVPKAVPIIKDIVKHWESIAGCYEYDILFVRRYLIDKEIIPMTLCTAEGCFVEGKMRVPVFESSSITNVSQDTLSNPKILAIDIETYNPIGKELIPEKHAALMIALYGGNFKKVITWKKFSTDNNSIEFVKSEHDLILKIKEYVKSYQPDIITGYYSDAFDLPYLKVRAQKQNISLDLGLDKSEVKVHGRQNIQTSIEGIIHLDIFKFIRRAIARTLKTDSLTLNAVSEELLGEQKHEIDINLLAKAWDENVTEHLDEFAKYNLQDARLTYLLAQKILPNIIEFVKVIGVPMFDISRMSFSKFVENYLLRQAHYFNEVCLNKPGYAETKTRLMESYAGGFVFEPKPGFYNDIVVFDFRSLYPTIIASHNISLETINCDCCIGTKKVPGKDIWFCTQKKGFIPSIIEDLITRRLRVKELLKKETNPLLTARSQALKDLANSFYGYLGFYAARWYSIDCARSVTAYGRDYVNMTIEKAKEAGFNVLYGDTDSCFFQLGHKTIEEAQKFCKEINKKLPGIMELEFEGYYPTGIFVSAKATETGAKKKYALLDDKGNMKITGFETIRRNTAVIAKDIQRKVLNIVLKEKDPHKALSYVRTVVTDLQDHKVPVKDLLIYTKISKNPAEYDTITPPVAAAKRMQEKGITVGAGSLVKFVVTKGKGRIRDKVKLEDETSQEDYDPVYYINNQILPSIERIFNVLGFKKQDILESKDQSSLNKFFS